MDAKNKKKNKKKRFLKTAKYENKGKDEVHLAIYAH